MGSVLVGVVGTLLGVLLGGALQHLQSTRDRAWQRETTLRQAKQAAYAEYVRAISASYAQAEAADPQPSENAALLAATAVIEILAEHDVAVPARELADTVIGTHRRLATDPEGARAEVEATDLRRRELVALFKRDLGYERRRPG